MKAAPHAKRLAFVAGFAAMGVFLSKALSGLGDGLRQIVVPGGAELRLEPGRYTIFHETRSTVDGKLSRVSGEASGRPQAVPPSPAPSRR
ncbi:hypothetical protein DFP91_4179 [Pseudorhodoplanes sinuspersici]|nr:hypothetical protein DFP91_4179 [Pseudorhodoplanes sinuspersici]